VTEERPTRLAQGPTRFGIVHVPLHRFDLNPTMQLERDLELVEFIDRIGYDEAFFGEHHSLGHEIIGTPEMFLAAAAQRSTRIKLGTGVVSVPYHNPFLVAERAVLLDHLSKGRHILGVGPGSLSSDAHMFGIDVADSRRKMHEGLDAIVRLLEGEVVTEKTDWFELVDARLQLNSYTLPRLEMVAACVGSPTGPRAAGKYGMGMINLAASDPEVIKALDGHWEVCQHEAELAGRTVSRDSWRLSAQFHLAETEAQARKDLEYNIGPVLEYLRQTSLLPPIEATSHEALMDEAEEKGILVVGTPAKAIEWIEGVTAATGGFGVCLVVLTDAVDFAAQKRSLELFAEQVIPYFRDQLARRRASYDWGVGELTDGRGKWERAIASATEEYREQRGDT
jgi:limonene 1,2-monooxygenase